MVSVIMPVFNASTYLNEAIQSILNQTFTDFEFIILNDGSTDQSEQVILSFTDKRIRYVKNDRNSGVIFTLNKGIDMAQGAWIARMDGDDIADSRRFEKQLEYLNTHPGTVVLATRITLINEKGDIIGVWKDDEAAITSQQIRAWLPMNNCIAHPTIMMSTSLLKKYRYHENQLHSEDYDLWLRLMSDGVDIQKLNKSLLNHRIHTSSVTRKQKQNVFYKIAFAKYRFAGDALKNGKLNAFVIKTVFYALQDSFKGLFKTIFSA